jgi:uncharacterized lipoprotein YddW (UPF0748 family)
MSHSIPSRGQRLPALLVRAPLVLAALLLAGCYGPRPARPPEAPTPPYAEVEVPAPPMTPVSLGTPPPLQREFRGAWVASVANIDWPSRPGLSTSEQQAELLRILDRAVALRLNAVILQVRPAADALYDSPYEPWSEYLTGQMGRAPDPYYDPLEFAVIEARRRGLELHAWFNPYRARHPTARSPISADHVSHTRPHVVRRYGEFLWMDPGEPEVQEHSLRVILDVLRRYDVDGIHIDDYFYPYPVTDAAGRRVPFPDDRSWERYRRNGGLLARDDWRRHNVDGFIERLYHEIKREKPWVKFGISPFGIWRPGYPPQIQTGFDQYAHIFADARKWLQEGWLDYYTPQLYWPIAQTPQSYPVLLRWWVEQNHHGRHIWPGNFTSRVMTGGQPLWPSREVLAQIHVTRGQQGATGNVHFSMRALMGDPDGLATHLVGEAYTGPALAPASPWLGGDGPDAPAARWEANGVGPERLLFEPRGGVPAQWWVVRLLTAEGWTTEVLPGWRRNFRVADGVRPVAVVVSAVGRIGVEGPEVTVIHPAAQ